MRKLMLGAVLALALPAAAMAQAPSATELATTACKAEKAGMGAKTFKQTYAAKSTAKAMKACLAKQGVAAEAAVKNASHECKAEAEKMTVVAFAEKYDANENGKNAHGKCVSAKAKAKSAEQTEARVSAADACKGMKKNDAAGFAAAFGDKKNAFGKCVSTKAKELAAAKRA